jgi:hypothetical protein
MNIISEVNMSQRTNHVGRVIEWRVHMRGKKELGKFFVYCYSPLNHLDEVKEVCFFDKLDEKPLVSLFLLVLLMLGNRTAKKFVNPTSLERIPNFDRPRITSEYDT